MNFNDEDHSYFNDDGEMYLSGTAFIKKFCKPFDKQKRAKAYAKKHKRKVEEVLVEWEKAGSDAISKGTFYHKIKEDEIISREFIDIDGENHDIFKPQWNGKLKVHPSQKLEPGVYPELIVWSDKYKIAGQADRVEITKTGKLNISDYKTSKEIKKSSYPNWDGSPQMMKFPLNSLQDCNFYQYALQLNLYAFLIKQHNIKLTINKLEIEHVIGEYDENEEKFKVEKVVIYKVPNLQKEVKIALEYYRTNGDKII